jgi:nucleotide-binding universal stress UspA family protein
VLSVDPPETVAQTRRVVRGGDWTWPPSRVVVVGEDSSLGARKAGEVAAGIGKIFGTQVLLVRTRPALAPMSEVVRHAQAATASPDDALRRYELDLEWRASRLERELGQRPRIRVMEGEVASVILKAAEESGKPALIAVGRRGLGMVDRLRLGSVSTKVLRAAAGPVLVCPS